ncbi:hypothetical protein [Halorubrum vacuolatum]|uniref:Uncharacterized protein n=1 Tax=Halorubrum vacuolatum TaxID=63740 RepID=A0A238X0I9_HALVU|nr:hypothetical protein [Halorubrum vacuolatum]SNR52180.1 hypothetical protein SAMN06264855_1127 [Halorubrum vacuolatum]
MSQAKHTTRSAVEDRQDTEFYLPGASTGIVARIEKLFNRRSEE